jgi:hypothetical protein|tara:strand:+ start:916 stop:1173 length:258 start_codon:yes stop_codon:yes gene_type:complete
MHITTKAVFEWDDSLKKYVEIHNEGYEYSGEIACASKLSEWWNVLRGIGHTAVYGILPEDLEYLGPGPAQEHGKKKVEDLWHIAQ